MLKYIPFLLLAIAVGCSQPDNSAGTATGGASPTTDAGSTQSATQLALPDATATLVKFTCPTMT